MADKKDCRECFYCKALVEKQEVKLYCFKRTQFIQPYFAPVCENYRLTTPKEVTK